MLFWMNFSKTLTITVSQESLKLSNIFFFVDNFEHND